MEKQNQYTKYVYSPCIHLKSLLKEIQMMSKSSSNKVITNKDIDSIIAYFNENSIEFRLSEKPLRYRSFYEIIDQIIKKLELNCDITLAH